MECGQEVHSQQTVVGDICDEDRKLDILTVKAEWSFSASSRPKWQVAQVATSGKVAGKPLQKAVSLFRGNFLAANAREVEKFGLAEEKFLISW